MTARSGPASMWLVLGLGLLCNLNVLQGAEDKGASVSLRAKWAASPYFMEAAEFTAEESQHKFWSFLEASFSKEQPTEVSQCWSHILNHTNTYLDNGVSKVVPLILASRQYSAKLAFYQQLRDQLHPNVQHCCFVDINGHVATTVSEVAQLITKAAAEPAGNTYDDQVLPFDHVHQADLSNPDAVRAVLYAPVGAACAKQLHFGLKVAANSGHTLYVYRPVLHSSCQATEGTCVHLGSQEPLLLPGWGVEAVLKNTEYSAMDEKDRKAEQQASGKGGKSGKASDKEELGEVKGFMFDTLVKRKPALAQELLTFRDHLLSSDEEETVKVWDIKDIGLQATQRIMQASDPLSLFTELSQNFPSVVSSLSRQQVNTSLRSAVAHNQQYISPGANFMLLNGLMVDINDFEYFGFLDRLRAELRLSQMLSDLGLATEDVKHVLQLRADDTSDALDEVRLDLGLGKENKDKVFFVNNLEMDAQYTEKYSRQISDILNVFPGRMRPLAVNAFNLVLILDPTSAHGVVWAELIYKMWQESMPMRLGMIPAIPSVIQRIRDQRSQPYAELKDPDWKEMTASEKFGLAFMTMEAAWGQYQAMIFWFSLSIKVQRSGSWGDVDETLKNIFEMAWQRSAAELARVPNAIKAQKKKSNVAWKDLKAGRGWSEQAAVKLNAVAKMLISKGIDDVTAPTGWFNGINIQFTGGFDAAALQQELMYRLMMEQQKIQEAVYYGKIEDGDDVLAKLLEEGSVIRWNPAIITSQPEYISLSGLVSDPDWKSVPRFMRPSVVAFKGDATQLDLHPATHIVVVNLASRRGRNMAAEAFRFLTQRLPASEKARVLLIFNPSEQKVALNNAQPTLLEIVMHYAITQSPQFTDPANPSKVTQHAVFEFLGLVLDDDALAARFSVPLTENSVTEVKVALAYADEAKLSGEVIKQGLLGILNAEHKAAGRVAYHPTKAMAAQRVIHARLAREALGLSVGVSALITNGRVVVKYPGDDARPPLSGSQVVLGEDLALLTSIMCHYQPAHVLASHVDEAFRSGRLAQLAHVSKRNTEEVVARLDDLVAVTFALMSSSAKQQSRQNSKQLNQVLGHMKGRTVEISPPEGSQPSGLHIVCILNPLTRPAQRISQVLSMLRASPLAPSVTLVLNPQRDLSDLPLKSFYRFALPDLQPGDEAYQSPPSPPSALFSRLPTKRVLTLNMDVPESWLVEAQQAQHDLDNLRLADTSGPLVYAELELSALMLTGSCIDVTQGNNRGTPPRGLQLHLGTPGKLHQVDTLVMSNLAYFQLKAAPGRWLLSLAPGRTQELYQLQSSTGIDDISTQLTMKALTAGAHDTDNLVDEISTRVVVTSLSGKQVILRVRKRPGKEKEDVLKAAGEKQQSSDDDMWGYGALDQDDDDDEEEDDSSSAKSGVKKPLGGDTINVFTVASGHMYERLQKIMILSVLNNTKSKVKFWFISNYMSPHHKQVIPAMAKKFGFEWEFVTYKWPHWLHKQTDKQRTIWAYKILFLDVLFPLDLERIIFVDSDQVVRTDLAELYHMDIKGRPYAYTPFCDNSKDMDEFRFWKGGFWLNHLQGKPYHISALYLVDLKRFRAMAAGDNLRVVYDQLSKDPNSLANLDQDLPNYAQHQIPIFSLPQEWLWCESWCGNATKAKAKTIDLCNNPRTKEPKLSAARRIIAEWPALDAKQAEFTRALDAELGFGQITSAQDPADKPVAGTKTDGAEDKSVEAAAEAQELGKEEAAAEEQAHDEL